MLAGIRVLLPVLALVGTSTIGCAMPVGDDDTAPEDEDRVAEDSEAREEDIADIEQAFDSVAAPEADADLSTAAAAEQSLGHASSAVVAAPLGSGWTLYKPTKRIHLDDSSGLHTFTWTEKKSVCSPTCADYKYDANTDTETFRIVDNRSNRAEIRLANEYSSGSRQFQGYVKFDSPLNDESLFQIFGSTSGATQLMIRGYASDNGSMKGGGKTLSTGCYGVERRVNVIHRQGKDIRIYVNGSLKTSFADDEDVTNYHKYGAYGTLKTNGATVKWRAARSYKDGAPPG
jgi:hypothetical protein